MRSSPRKGGRGYILLLPLIVFIALLRQDTAAQLKPRNFAVELRAETKTDPPEVTLHWKGDGLARRYFINRKPRAGTEWTEIGVAIGHHTWFVDKNVTPGVGYEYQVIKEGTLEYTGYGYIYTAINLPPVDDRGKIILLVENSVAATLIPELARLEDDLVGDGWRVVRRNVDRAAKPPEVKEIIKAAYAEDPANTHALFLFGNIPVPYSGDLTPDQHDNHKGAWPTDTYYGDLDGEWTDTTVTALGAERTWNHNVPGDGKFDQNAPPTKLELEVGRVDLSRMTCFINKSPPRNEIDLLRQYLDKDHRFRHGQMRIDDRALIYDRIGLTKPDPLATMAWRNFAVFVRENIDEAKWGEYVPMVSSNSYLWTSVVAGGGFGHSDGVGTSDIFALNVFNAVFTMFSGSYYGDWDNESSFLRAPLGASGSMLVSVFSGQPQWICHTMALGETIGAAAKITQENGPEGIYIPHNGGAGQVHVTLHGDPTLRAHPIAPPGKVTGVELDGSMLLSWEPTVAGSFEGYFIYRAATPDGPFTRITPEPLQVTSFLVEQAAGKHFIVKTAALTKSLTGTYWNTSQGVFYPERVHAVADSLPSAPRNLAVTEVRRDAVTLSWLSTSVNHTEFELERLTPGVAGFQKIATVPREVSSYRDASLPVSGTYGYRVRAVNPSGHSDYSNPVFTSTETAMVEFIGFDATTRGAWQGVYGAEGYAIPELPEKLPFNTTLSVSNVFAVARSMEQDDVRALFLPDSTNRTANHWFHRYPFALHLSFGDTATHQVALYAMDLNRADAGYDIAIHDAVSGDLLDRRTVPNINEGVFAVYNIRRQVYIRILPTSPILWDNVQVYGLFFDVPKIHPVRIEPSDGTFSGKTLVRLSSFTPGVDIRYTLDGSAPTPESARYTEPFWLYATAQLRAQAFKDGYPPSEIAEAHFQNAVINRVNFIRWDEEVKGTWPGKFGADGYWVPHGGKALPLYAEVTVRPDSMWLWSDNASNDRALFRDANSQERIASAWYSETELELDLAVFDTRRRAVALYFLDWDNQGRSQVVELLDGTGAVVDRFYVEEFTNGKYLVLGLKGYTKVRIRKQGAGNIVLNGIFFDLAPVAVNVGAPVPLSNPSLRNGVFRLDATGFEDERFCVDASSDFKTWLCTQTNLFTLKTISLEIPVTADEPHRFHRAHIVP